MIGAELKYDWAGLKSAVWLDWSCRVNCGAGRVWYCVNLIVFWQDVTGCCCVNPGRLAKGKVAGTFSRLVVNRTGQATSVSDIAAQVVKIWLGNIGWTFTWPAVVSSRSYCWLYKHVYKHCVKRVCNKYLLVMIKCCYNTSKWINVLYRPRWQHLFTLWLESRITNGADRRMVQSRRNVLKALISQDLPAVATAHMQVENFIITVCPCYNADHVIVWFVTPEMNENGPISRQNRLEASIISPTNVANIIIPKHKTNIQEQKPCYTIMRTRYTALWGQPEFNM